MYKHKKQVMVRVSLVYAPDRTYSGHFTEYCEHERNLVTTISNGNIIDYSDGFRDLDRRVFGENIERKHFKRIHFENKIIRVTVTLLLCILLETNFVARRRSVHALKTSRLKHTRPGDFRDRNRISFDRF